MSSAGEDEIFLFVAGEPETGVDSLGKSMVKSKDGTFGRVVEAFFPFGARTPISLSAHPPGDIPPAMGEAQPPLTDSRPWHLPPQQVQCAEMVLKIARREQRRVTVVDVNRASVHQDAVDRWVGPNDVLPLLVRPDGSRLEGIEEFAPQKIRRFIGRP
ncbi:MAG TPA: hypothetical protein VGG32_08845 [Thermoplasmata archaeon]|jgi:hypothetical protein